MTMKRIIGCLFLVAIGVGFPVSLYLQRDTAEAASSSCANVTAAVERSASALSGMFNELGPAPYDRLPVGKWALRDQTRTSSEQLLRMIVNTPQCFSADRVAAAQTSLRQLTQR